MSVPAGWYNNPNDLKALRWWDGEKWTESVSKMISTEEDSEDTVEINTNYEDTLEINTNILETLEIPSIEPEQRQLAKPRETNLISKMHFLENLPYRIVPDFTKKELSGTMDVFIDDKPTGFAKIPNVLGKFLNTHFYPKYTAILLTVLEVLIFVAGINSRQLTFERLGEILTAGLVGVIIMMIAYTSLNYSIPRLVLGSLIALWCFQILFSSPLIGVAIFFLLAAIPLKNSWRLKRNSQYKIIHKDRRSNYLKRNLPTPLETAVPIWGIAGANVSGSAEVFGKDRAKLGAEGEKILGLKLEELSKKYPQVRVFHGLYFKPNQSSSKNWDIDHAVLIGKNLFLIDAKNWRGNSFYSWSNDGENVLRDNAPFAGGEVHMNEAKKLWEQYNRDSLGRNRGHISSWIVPVNSRTTTNNRNSKGTELVNLNQMFLKLEKYAASPELNYVDRNLMMLCMAQMH